MKKKLFLQALVLVFFIISMQAQVVISDTGGTTADPNAVLDLQTISKGLLLPRLTHAQMTSITSPANGLLIYNTENNRLYFYNGAESSWKELVTDSYFITVTDEDGNTYNTVWIGTQCWMNENLATTKLNDGTSIPLVTDNTEWENLTTPGYCWYNNDEQSYGDTYGALYNWHAVNSGKLCPTGWHVPSDEEWKTMEIYIGLTQTEADELSWRGTDEGGKLKETGTTHWNSPNTGATNETGFTALPGGARVDTGPFGGLGVEGYWFTSSEYVDNGNYYAYVRVLNYNKSETGRFFSEQATSFSVRCVKD